MQQLKAKVSFLPKKIVGRRMRALNGTLLDRVYYAKGGRDLPGGMHRNLELALAHQGYLPGKELGGPKNRVQILRKTRREPPAYRWLDRDGWRAQDGRTRRQGACRAR